RHRQAQPGVAQAVLAGVDDQPGVADGAAAVVDAAEVVRAAQVLVRPEAERNGLEGVAHWVGLPRSQALPGTALPCRLRLLFRLCYARWLGGGLRGGASPAVRSQAEPGNEEGLTPTARRRAGPVGSDARTPRSVRGCGRLSVSARRP